MKTFLKKHTLDAIIIIAAHSDVPTDTLWAFDALTNTHRVCTFNDQNQQITIGIKDATDDPACLKTALDDQKNFERISNNEALWEGSEHDKMAVLKNPQNHDRMMALKNKAAG